MRSVACLLRRGFSQDWTICQWILLFFLIHLIFLYLSQNKTHLVSLTSSFTITEEGKTKVNSVRFGIVLTLLLKL